jgi:hypothetical protein
VKGASAVMVFMDFFVAATIKLLMAPFIIPDQANWNLFSKHRTIFGQAIKVLGGEFAGRWRGVYHRTADRVHYGRRR